MHKTATKPTVKPTRAAATTTSMMVRPRDLYVMRRKATKHQQTHQEESKAWTRLIVGTVIVRALFLCLMIEIITQLYCHFNSLLAHFIKVVIFCFLGNSFSFFLLLFHGISFFFSFGKVLDSLLGNFSRSHFPWRQSHKVHLILFF